MKPRVRPPPTAFFTMLFGICTAWGCDEVRCPDGRVEVPGEGRCVLADGGSSDARDPLERGNSACDADCASECVEGICNDPVQLAAGQGHTCALFRAGNVRCWGLGQFGQLGYGNTEPIGDDEHPTVAGDVDVGGKVAHLSAGSAFTCAVLRDSGVRCWGRGREGQLGYGNTSDVGDNETPASVGNIDLGGAAVQVSAGSEHACAVLEDGRLRCWGNGANGRLGYGNTETIGDDETPASAGDVNVGGRVVQVEATEATFMGDQAGERTCAILDTGRVRCWGFNNQSLGYPADRIVGDIGDTETPADVGDVDVGGTVTDIASGFPHVCVLLDDGNVRCWGGNAFGALGYGTTPLSVGDDETPASFGDVPVGGKVTQLAAGSVYTCALLETRDVRCWGIALRLGYEAREDIGDDELPSSAGVVNLGGPVVSIEAGMSHTCVIMEGGQIRCWGGSPLGYPRIEGSLGDDPGEMPPPDVQVQ